MQGIRIRRTGERQLLPLLPFVAIIGVAAACAPPIERVTVTYAGGTRAPKQPKVTIDQSCGRRCIEGDGAARFHDTQAVHGAAIVTVRVANANPYCESFSPKLSSVAFIPQNSLTAAIVPSGMKAVSSVLPKKLKPVPHPEAREPPEAPWLKPLRAAADRVDTAATALTITRDGIVAHQKQVESFAARCAAGDGAAQMRTGSPNLKADTETLAGLGKLRNDLKPAAQALADAEIELSNIPLLVVQLKHDDREGIAAAVKVVADEIAELKKSAQESRDALTELDAAAKLLARLDEKVDGLENGAEVVTKDRYFDPNQMVTVELNRGTSPLSSSKTANAGATNTVSTPDADAKQPLTFHTLSPLWLDVGVGPAFTTRTLKTYSLVTAPGQPLGAITSAEQLNMDGVVSVSGYYQPRYMDGSLRPRWFYLVPRPMLGLSLRQAFSSFYVGGQVDPAQFLDLSFGARIFSQQDLAAGFQTGDAIPAGSAVPTVTHLTMAPFVSVSTSVNLFAGWLTGIIKSGS